MKKNEKIVALEKKLDSLDKLEREILFSIVDAYSDAFICLVFPNSEESEEQVIKIIDRLYLKIKRIGFYQFSKEEIKIIFGEYAIRITNGEILKTKKHAQRLKVRIERNNNLMHMIKTDTLASWFNNIESVKSA